MRTVTIINPNKNMAPASKWSAQYLELDLSWLKVREAIIYAFSAAIWWEETELKITYSTLSKTVAPHCNAVEWLLNIPVLAWLLYLPSPGPARGHGYLEYDNIPIKPSRTIFWPTLKLNIFLKCFKSQRVVLWHE